MWWVGVCVCHLRKHCIIGTRMSNTVSQFGVEKKLLHSRKMGQISGEAIQSQHSPVQRDEAEMGAADWGKNHLQKKKKMTHGSLLTHCDIEKVNMQEVKY